jgi:flagellar biosynthesis protein FlhB
MSARPHAPSQQRIAEARAGGHVPRAPLLRLLGLLGLLAVGGLQARALGADLIALFEAPLSGASPRELLQGLLERTAWSLAVILAVVLLGTWLAQGPAFVIRRSNLSAASDPTATALFALGTLVLLAFLLHDTRLFDVALADYAWAFGLLAVACLAIDIAFARARWFASLWMTRREYLDAQRDQGVSPELAAARRRARQP